MEKQRRDAKGKMPTKRVVHKINVNKKIWGPKVTINMTLH